MLTLRNLYTVTQLSNLRAHRAFMNGALAWVLLLGMGFSYVYGRVGEVQTKISSIENARDDEESEVVSEEIRQLRRLAEMAFKPEQLGFQREVSKEDRELLIGAAQARANQVQQFNASMTHTSAHLAGTPQTVLATPRAAPPARLTPIAPRALA